MFQLRRLRIAIVAIAIALTAVPLGAAPVAAQVVGGCSNTDQEKILLYENTIGDTSDGNDALWKCGSEQFLEDEFDAPSCNGFFLFVVEWMNCVSSYALWLPTGRKICFYSAGNYRVFLESKVGRWLGSRVNMVNNDDLGSFKFIAATQLC